MRIAEYKDGKLTYRDATAEEEEQYRKEQAEAEQLAKVPTDVDKFEAQLMYTALMTDTLLEEESSNE